MQYMYVARVVFVSSSNSSLNTVQMRRRGPKGELKILTKRTAREPLGAARGGSVWVWMSVGWEGEACLCEDMGVCSVGVCACTRSPNS